MRNALTFAAAGFLAVLLSPSGQGADAQPKAEESTCQYGTKVHFEKTPTDAAKKALKEEKLVCILHVSGDFENPDFT